MKSTAPSMPLPSLTWTPWTWLPSSMQSEHLGKSAGTFFDLSKCFAMMNEHPRPLHGIPILVKNNIATKDGMNTTCASLSRSFGFVS